MKLHIESYITNDPYKAPCYFCKGMRKTFVCGVENVQYVYYICIPCVKKHLSEITVCWIRYEHFKALVSDLKLKR